MKGAYKVKHYIWFRYIYCLFFTTTVLFFSFVCLTEYHFQSFPSFWLYLWIVLVVWQFFLVWLCFFSTLRFNSFFIGFRSFFSPYFSLAFCIYRLSAFAWNARPILRFLNSKRLVLFTQPFQKRFLKEHVLFKLLYLKNISQITNIKNPKTKWHEEMKRVKHHNLQISVKDWLCLRGAINECSKESNWNCIYIYLYLYVRCTKPIQTRTNNSKQKRKIKKNHQQQQQQPKQSFKIST